MSKQIDALRLALEALNRGETKLRYEAIAAIREALAEQPAQGCEFCSHPLYAGTKCKNCGREQLAQQDVPKLGCVNHDCDKCKAQQQEPVRVPVTDNTYNYAKSLAEAIFKQHFASDEHYSSGRIVWGVNDTVIGILTQIDNMVADMVRRPAQRKPLTDDPLQGAVDWLLEADGEYFCTATVQRTLRIGYNRAKRLCDTAKERAAHGIKD